MKKEIIQTADGSHTVAVPDLSVTYHSVHGAVQESRHVFIQAGLCHLLSQPAPEPISILEVGFGTGLNALLTAVELEKQQASVYYAALEPNPMTLEEAMQLNYCGQLERMDLQEDFIRLHACPWNKSLAVSEEMLMHKSSSTLQTFDPATKFHLVYYDAFAPSAQPELWTQEIFEKLASLLLPGGLLVTYCSKGDVRRAMTAAGLVVEKLPGPKGKREMVRAVKP